MGVLLLFGGTDVLDGSESRHGLYNIPQVLATFSFFKFAGQQRMRLRRRLQSERMSILKRHTLIC